jgi:hypothetical protein
MPGMTQEEFKAASEEIRASWDRADSKEAGFRVILEYGRKYGYKNVIAAIEGRLPKQFTREKPIDQWVAERRAEEE